MSFSALKQLTSSANMDDFEELLEDELLPPKDCNYPRSLM